MKEKRTFAIIFDILLTPYNLPVRHTLDKRFHFEYYRNERIILSRNSKRMSDKLVYEKNRNHLAGAFISGN